MPVTTTCPSCQTVYNLADSLRGKKVRCKECQEPFVVGAAAGRELAPFAQAGRVTPSRPRTRPLAPAGGRFREDEAEAEVPRRSARRWREEDEDEVPQRRGRPVAKSRLPLVLVLSIGGVLLAAGVGVG